ncbi:MAG: hypothetical protein KGH66_03990 [Candidatus Micrarchaeota archaeon]|nr:hypothetical protein [Candidatus Micrarchaeota archaeon]
MRISIALVCFVLMAQALGIAMALPANYYTGNSALNYTSNVVSINFAMTTGLCPLNYTPSSGSGVQGNATDADYCEIVVGGNTTGAFPLWLFVPAFAGTSILGVNSLGASVQGFPTFDGNVVATQCGPGGTPVSCNHPEYVYSPIYTALEHKLGVYNGIFGLPEGIGPTPAHTHANGLDYLGPTGRWYIIPVFVFDPNIMPNATTGACAQIVQSNLTSPTGNCLTSFAAIWAAMNTTSSAVGAANAGNPLWSVVGNATYQVAVPGVSRDVKFVDPTTGMLIAFTPDQLSYYATPALNVTAIDVPEQSCKQQSSGTGTTELALVLILAILAAGAVVALDRRIRPRASGD